MTCGIYKIVYNDKLAYVGSSVNIERRWRQHRDTLKRGVHSNFLLQRAWDKYGVDAFKFYIIEECFKESLCEREQFHIDNDKPLFNLSDANGRHEHTEETKAKMRGRIVSKETREKLSKALKGRESGRKGVKTGVIPKTAFKKGEIPWNKGKKLPPSWNKGKNLTEEHKRKLSESHKNRIPTEAQLKYWESMKGKTLPDEQKEKIKKSIMETLGKNREKI